MTCSAVLNLLDPKKFKVSGSVFFGETDLLNSSEKQRREYTETRLSISRKIQ